MTTLQDDSSPQDAPKEYEFDVAGIKITTQRTDPYGYFYLKQTKGKLPDRFTGAYTSLYEVERAIREYTTYVNNLKTALPEESKKDK